MRKYMRLQAFLQTLFLMLFGITRNMIQMLRRVLEDLLPYRHPIKRLWNVRPKTNLLYPCTKSVKALSLVVQKEQLIHTMRAGTQTVPAI